MKTNYKNYVLLFSIIVSIALLQSFKKPTNVYVSINGEWENYTIAKDENGNGLKKDGENIYRKIILTFEGAGTIGEVDGIKKTYNMIDASGIMYFTESFGPKLKKTKNKQEEFINSLKHVLFRQAQCGFFFDSDNSSSLKIVCGRLFVLDQNTTNHVESEKDDKNFKAIKILLDKIKIKKITEKKLNIEWDYNENGKIDEDEIMVFEAVN